MRLRLVWLLTTLIIIPLLLNACTTTGTAESPPSSKSEETNTQTSTEESSSSTQETESEAVITESTTETEETTESEENKGISTWVMAEEPVRGFRDEPSEKFFKAALVDIDYINSKGGRLTFKMNPVVDPTCAQTFKVGWEFDFDVQTVHEGQIINVTVFNGEGLAECYKNAKTSMAYGGELTIDLKPPGYSHFFYEEAYKKYQEGYSQYLFALSDQTGLVGPPGGMEPAASSTGALLVKDGIYTIGESDAPYGNFSFSIGAGGVFYYTVTYLYEAVTE